MDIDIGTKKAVALTSGIFCAIGGYCAADLFHASGEVTFGCILIGFVVGYAAAFTSVLFSFLLIVVSSGLILHSCSQMAEQSRQREELYRQYPDLRPKPTP